jgi:hypothetical protein
MIVVYFKRKLKGTFMKAWMIDCLQDMVVSNLPHHHFATFIVPQLDGTCLGSCKDLFNLQLKPNNIKKKQIKLFWPLLKMWTKHDLIMAIVDHFN